MRKHILVITGYDVDSIIDWLCRVADHLDNNSIGYDACYGAKNIIDTSTLRIEFVTAHMANLLDQRLLSKSWCQIFNKMVPDNRYFMDRRDEPITDKDLFLYVYDECMKTGRDA